MSIKENAIILGGTSAHIELINRLKERGYRTVLVDYYKNPIAKPYADEHIQASTLDKDIVLQIARGMSAVFVITSCIDQANITAIYVNEKLGLHVPYSYQTALNVTDKKLMKKIMWNNGIPTSRFLSVSHISQIEEINLDYPLIVKPADSNGSKGVNKIDNEKHLKDATEVALSLSRSHNAIVEEFKHGREIGVDCFIVNHEPHILTIRERNKISESGMMLQQILGTITPADISDIVKNKIYNIVLNIAKSFNLDNTPLMLQAIISDDNVSVIEFAPRIGGGESSRMIKLITGFDIISQTINSFLGVQINIDYRSSDQYYSEVLLYGEPSVFGEVTGLNQLVDDKQIEYYSIYKTRGMKIAEEITSVNRLGAITVKGSTVSEIRQKILNAISSIEYYDIFGKPMLKRYLYDQYKL